MFNINCINALKEHVCCTQLSRTLVSHHKMFYTSFQCISNGMMIMLSQCLLYTTFSYTS